MSHTDMPTFSELGLPQRVVDALAERGVTTPFPIQAASIPDALAGRDILGRGRTGSGKTLSFGLPLLNRLAGGRTKAKRPRGIVLVPTRELAMQVADSLEPYGNVLNLDIKVVCGGTSMQRQIFALQRGVDVLVATPGRLRDLMSRGVADLTEVEVAVLDEADQMADMGFLPEVTEILDQVPAGGQRMLFSATLENEIDTLVKRYLSSPVTHEVDPPAGAVSTMEHHVLVVKPNDKSAVTAMVAARQGRTIAFVRTQLGCERVVEELNAGGVRALALHGGMNQAARTKTLADFKEGKVPLLVATGVAARGIHVDGVDMVLHVDPAGTTKDYLHRAGRTARAGESGIVATIVLPHQRRSMFKLLEEAGVEAERHRVEGAFSEELTRITGARSLADVRADAASRAVEDAESEIVQLTRRLQAAEDRLIDLQERARKATEYAEGVRNGTIVEDDREHRAHRPRRDFDRNKPRGANAGGGERRFGDRDRGGERGGFKRDDRHPRDGHPRDGRTGGGYRGQGGRKDRFERPERGYRSRND
ncbi:RNA helicase [Actinorhabdospora filicis]|uniref:RNA helicase n=1 Tax=Actinorhabdospora filicis TaxID=1785913 RepID=A0A9W6SN22_9ACTN|nr:DEAD/DEAH box helicase [Actinorhabdospora filicis]GLZ78988.1 RNA helicase [Actinorhabdospora filicis]